MLVPRLLVASFVVPSLFAIASCRTSSGPAATGTAPPATSVSEEQLLRTGRPSPSVDELLAQMTLDEKIGQMTQADTGTLKKRPADVRDLALGSVLNGGSALPANNTPSGWADVYDSYQEQALRTRLKIPMIYGVDAVHGHSGMKGATIFPHNIGLGCTRNPALVEKISRITAVEVAATGIDWTFSPCVAVARDERWGRTYEGFGETPELATMMGPAAIRGYQTGMLGRDPTGVLACAKHFVGDGGTTGGIDQGDTRVTPEEMRKLHLPGYIEAIRAGVGSIMVSYNMINGVRMHQSRELITDLLKGEMGFKGFVVSDWDGIDKNEGADYTSKVALAVNAGIDLFMVPEHYRRFIDSLRQVVKDGRVPMSRIDDAVRRILQQKVVLQLWERPFADRSLLANVGSAAHREVARQAVRESLVVLKNDRRALPLSKKARILVAGSRADDMGVQCGGWCIGWQGTRGAVTPGTTLLAGIRQVAPDAKVTFSPDGQGAADADVVVVVVGEDPYAEMKGDRKDLALAKDELELIDRLRASGKPVITVLLSGRPMILGTALTSSRALVAAWLPGTEGAGVADVLFGDHKPSGKLSHSWPRSMAQIPINHGDAKYDPLFAYGFGLTY